MPWKVRAKDTQHKKILWSGTKESPIPSSSRALELRGHKYRHFYFTLRARHM